MQAYDLVRKSLLKDDHVDQRETFSNPTRNSSENIWKKVAFTDEKTFQSNPNDQIKVKRSKLLVNV